MGIFYFCKSLSFFGFISISFNYTINVTQEKVDKTMLLACGETPDEVCQQLRMESQAFAEHIEQREQDWTQVQMGREWSPAQEVEHVMLTNHLVGRGIRLLLSDKEIQPMPKLEGQRKNGKRQAPEGLVPSPEGLAWNKRQEQWQENIQTLQNIATQVQSTPERTIWHPFLGELDALEWLQMVTWHLGHHRQLLEQSLKDGLA